MYLNASAFCFNYVFTAGLQNDHKSIMKLIKEKIHQLHEEARNKQNSQTNEGEMRTWLIRINNDIHL